MAELRAVSFVSDTDAAAAAAAAAVTRLTEVFARKLATVVSYSVDMATALCSAYRINLFERKPWSAEIAHSGTPACIQSGTDRTTSRTGGSSVEATSS